MAVQVMVLKTTSLLDMIKYRLMFFKILFYLFLYMESEKLVPSIELLSRFSISLKINGITFSFQKTLYSLNLKESVAMGFRIGVLTKENAKDWPYFILSKAYSETTCIKRLAMTMIKWYGVKRHQQIKGKAFHNWGRYLKWEMVKRLSLIWWVLIKLSWIIQTIPHCDNRSWWSFWSDLL